MMEAHCPLHPDHRNRMPISISIQPLDLFSWNAPFASMQSQLTLQILKTGLCQTSIVAGCAVIGTPYPRTCCWQSGRSQDSTKRNASPSWARLVEIS